MLVSTPLYSLRNRILKEPRNIFKGKCLIYMTADFVVVVTFALLVYYSA